MKKTSTPDFRQTRKVGVAGEFINQMMGNNSTFPVVGEGMTELLYSDRHGYHVMEVSKDCKRARVRRCNPIKWNFDYAIEFGEPNKHDIWISWKWGSWRVEGSAVRWTDEYRAKHDDPVWYRSEERKSCFHPEGHPNYGDLKEIPGKTKRHKTYHKINCIWGRMDEYCDPSF